MRVMPTIMAMVFAIPGAAFCKPLADRERPSFLVLLADDLRHDAVGAAGNAICRTPNIDALAAKGTRFSNAFVTTSICCVSRASYFTGQYACRHGVGDFRTPLSVAALAASYPVRLKQMGYRVGCFGKWGIGGQLPKDRFDAWNAWSDQGKYFENFGGERLHNSEFLARWSIDFLRAQPADKPFCLTVLFKAPHDPMEPDPRDKPLFSDVTFPMPPSGASEQFAQLPAFLRSSLGVERARKDIPTDKLRQEYTRDYHRLVAGLDRAVGKIMAALAEHGLADNTVVVFASDNGYMLGEHGMVHKWLMYEESIRVPLIVVDPRLPLTARGKTSSAFALNVDVAPTLLDLAGLSASPGTDGRSLRPLLQTGDPPADWRTDFVYEHHYHHNGAIPRTEGLRTADWKYVRYFDDNAEFEQLFDLRQDGIEVQNLAKASTHARQLSELRARYLARRAEYPHATR